MMRRARWPHCVCSRSILQPCFGDDGYLAPRPSSTGITRRTYTIGPTQLHIGCAVGELNRQTNRDVGIALPLHPCAGTLNSATYPKKFKSLLHTSCLSRHGRSYTEPVARCFCLFFHSCAYKKCNIVDSNITGERQIFVLQYVKVVRIACLSLLPLLCLLRNG